MKKIIQFILSTALVMSVVGCTNNKTYNIKFVNDDQTLLQEVTVKHGEVPEYTGETPTKTQTAEFTYTFKEWTPQIVAAKSDATYTAVYESAKRKYTITFNNDDGTLISSSLVEYGTIPTPPSDPSKESSAKYNYSFDGWDKEIVSVTEDATYTAIYSRTIRDYLITFLDEDESTVLKAERFDYGATPTCDDPSKAPTQSKVYTFKGWNPEVVPVISDATYVAKYEESVRKYTITFLDDDEETVLKSGEVEYGVMPTCDEPSKEPTETQSFFFDGWSPEVIAVVGDATYVATYRATARLYEIKFVDDDGNVIDVQNLEYGVSPVVPSTDRQDDEEFSYTFVSWDKEIADATEDTVYTASYSRVRICYKFDSENLDSYVGASMFDLTEEDEEKQDVTWVMAKDRSTDTLSLPGTSGKYLQYQAFEKEHTYRISLPRIDFRVLKSLSSQIRLFFWSGDGALAFTQEEAEAKSGLCFTGSYHSGRIEIVTTAENVVEVKLNVKADSSVKISKTFNDEDIYKGDKSIELYLHNTDGDKYLTIENFAPRRDRNYLINKDRILQVNDTYSWAAFYIQFLVGETFLPTPSGGGKYTYIDKSVLQLYRNDELVGNAAVDGTTPNVYDAFGLSDKHFSMGAGGAATAFNWFAYLMSGTSSKASEVFQDNDVLVMNGTFVGRVEETKGYGIEFDLTIRINTVENGYQGSSVGYKFTLI